MRSGGKRKGREYGQEQECKRAEQQFHWVRWQAGRGIADAALAGLTTILAVPGQGLVLTSCKPVPTQPRPAC